MAAWTSWRSSPQANRPGSYGNARSPRSTSSRPTSSASSGSTRPSAPTSPSAARRRSPKPGEGGRTADGGVPRRADLAQRPRHDRRDPDDVLLRGLRGQRARLRPGTHRPAESSRLRRPRQDEHPRVRDDRVHRLGVERPLQDAVGPVAERRRLERRRRSGTRSRPLPDRAGLGRRWLDPHPCLLLRRPRLQAVARPDLERAVRAGDRARHDRRRSRGRPPTPRHTSTSCAATSGATCSRRPRPSGRSPRRWERTREAARRRDDRAACGHARRRGLHRRGARSGRAARLARPRSREAAPDWGGDGLDGRLQGRSGRPSRRSTRSPTQPCSARSTRRSSRCGRDAERRLHRERSPDCSSARGSSSRSGPSTTCCSHRRSQCRPVPVGWDTEPDDPWEQFDRAVSFTPFTAAFNVTGSRRSRCRCTGPTTGCRSASSSSARRSATLSSSGSRAQLEAARPWADRRPPHS